MFYNGVGSDYNVGHLGYGSVFLSSLIKNVTKVLNPCILDVGAGTGLLLDKIEVRAKKIALEPSKEMIECAKMRMAKNRSECLFVNSFLGDADSIPNSSVDVFVIANAIHWLLTTDEEEVKNLKSMQRVAKKNAEVIVITHRPDKEDAFWGAFLSQLKKHPQYNVNSEFSTAKNRCGGHRIDMVKKFVEKPSKETERTMSILFSPEEGAIYAATITPYKDVPYEEIMGLAKQCFDKSINVGEKYVKTSWLTIANYGKLR
jgi:ubiquinone/menaquinone biosynthesis C-methylase UbiE